MFRPSQYLGTILDAVVHFRFELGMMLKSLFSKCVDNRPSTSVRCPSHFQTSLLDLLSLERCLTAKQVHNLNQVLVEGVMNSLQPALLTNDLEHF